MKDTHVLSMYLIFCFFGVALVSLIVGTALSPSPLIPFPEKIGIAGLFILCCIIGISFTFRPNWLRQHFRTSSNKEYKQQAQVKRSFQGHHPDCLAFQNHTIHWNKKTWCAGCLGLFVGLCGAIIVMLLYLLTDVQLTKIMSYFFIFLGLLMIFVVYGEISYQNTYAVVHVVLNSILPISFALITIAVGEISGSFVYGFFAILLCFLWLDTRIQLSKWRHRRLCTQCSEACKMYPYPVNVSR